MLAVSNTGEWLTPLVIGKSNRPRSFRHLDISKLPVIWRANKSAWMTSLIFTEWLQGINKLMISQQRKILLFIDNCTAHPHMNLSNVELKFFPVNTTSLLQPLDQGIIQNFKTIYRKYFLKSVIASTMVCNSATEIAKSISILDAIHMIKRAVDEIKQSTVMNCFAKAGFSEFQEILEIDIESKKIKELLCEFEESITESVYTSFDNKVPISESIEVESAVERIFEEIIQENISNENREKQVDDEDEEDPDSKFIPSHQDAYQMVQLLKKYATEQGNQEMMRAICFFECEHNSHIVEIHKKSRQMEITDYFSLVKIS